MIAAKANNESNCTIQAILNKGKYYLVHDINYRYVQKDMMDIIYLVILNIQFQLKNVKKMLKK